MISGRNKRCFISLTCLHYNQELFLFQGYLFNSGGCFCIVAVVMDYMVLVVSFQGKTKRNMEADDGKRRLSSSSQNDLHTHKRIKSLENDVEMDISHTHEQTSDSTSGQTTNPTSDERPFPLPVSNTLNMSSQLVSEMSDTQHMDADDSGEDPDMFDESLCFRSDSDSQVCQLLRRISDAILGTDDIDGPSSLEMDGVEPEMMNIVTYLQQRVDHDNQALIAKYLSSGSLEFVHLNIDNVHSYFHVAVSLHLKQLRDHCLNFCFRSNQQEIMAQFQGCHCMKDITRESSTGYQRSQSIISNPDDNLPPQYYIVFTYNTNGSSDKTVKNTPKVIVKVIDMSERHDVFNREVDQIRQLGEGFACCSCEIKESPYVFVSGGAGKGTQMMKYDVVVGRWEKCPKMLHARSNHMMLSAGENAVFVLSGKEVPCVEEYDIKSKKWHERASLITHVTSAAVVFYRAKIYIFGGKTPAGAVATVQYYDAARKEVSRLEDLPCAFDGGKCVVFNDKIYIATYDGHMICFDPSNGHSYLCCHQPVQRRHFGMFVRNERIYLVGGVPVNVDENWDKKPQHRYNVEKDMWVEKYKLCNNFPVLGSCVINYPKKCSIIPFDEG